MRRPTPTGVLIRHFLFRFFDNETVQVDGDATTTVARAVAMMAAPSLLFAFFLQTHYPGRPLWAAVEDQLFFVAFAFAAMGVVTNFSGESLFPDRIYFLVLTPLPLGRLQMLGSKAAAMVLFLALFLAGSEVFGLLLYPAIAHVLFFRQFAAHLLAVSLAGSFAALAVLALNGLLLLALDARRFRLSRHRCRWFAVRRFFWSCSAMPCMAMRPRRCWRAGWTWRGLCLRSGFWRCMTGGCTGTRHRPLRERCCPMRCAPPRWRLTPCS